MKVLIMNCSPVRDGATAEIARMAAENLETRHEVRSVCVDDYVISFCRGCRVCHTTAQCFMRDDMDRLIREYEWADIILSVSPSYWAAMPSTLTPTSAPISGGICPAWWKSSRTWPSAPNTA